MEIPKDIIFTICKYLGYMETINLCDVLDKQYHNGPEIWRWKLMNQFPNAVNVPHQPPEARFLNLYLGYLYNGPKIPSYREYIFKGELKSLEIQFEKLLSLLREKRDQLNQEQLKVRESEASMKLLLKTQLKNRFPILLQVFVDPNSIPLLKTILNTGKVKRIANFLNLTPRSRDLIKIFINGVQTKFFGFLYFYRKKKVLKFSLSTNETLLPDKLIKYANHVNWSSGDILEYYGVSYLPAIIHDSQIYQVSK